MVHQAWAGQRMNSLGSEGVPSSTWSDDLQLFGIRMEHGPASPRALQCVSTMTCHSCKPARPERSRCLRAFGSRSSGASKIRPHMVAGRGLSFTHTHRRLWTLRRHGGATRAGVQSTS